MYRTQRDAPEARHNVEVFTSAESLAAAKPQLKRVRLPSSPYSHSNCPAATGHRLALYREIPRLALLLLALLLVLLPPRPSPSDRPRLPSSQSHQRVQALLRRRNEHEHGLDSAGRERADERGRRTRAECRAQVCFHLARAGSSFLFALWDGIEDTVAGEADHGGERVAECAAEGIIALSPPFCFSFTSFRHSVPAIPPRAIFTTYFVYSFACPSFLSLSLRQQ